jgi:hypothetical protein
MYFFLLSYLILGAGIKYIDDAFDEQVFNKKIAMVLAPALGLLWAYAMLVSAASAVILLAILCAVLLKGKIDNYAHLAGLLVILSIVFLAGVELMILPLILLTGAALLDEVGNDFIDYNQGFLRKSRFWHQFTVHFFGQRWMLKIAVLSLVLMNIIPFYFFLAIILFDAAYLSVRWYSHSKQRISDVISPLQTTEVNIA